MKAPASLGGSERHLKVLLWHLEWSSAGGVGGPGTPPGPHFSERPPGRSKVEWVWGS